MTATTTKGVSKPKTVEDNPYSMSVWELTPDLASELLNKTPPYQRNLRPSKVEGFARDISAGEWPLTHQPIAIDEDGLTIDGRHRCAAVCLAGKSIFAYVAIGVPKTMYRYIDTGTPRQLVDVSDMQKHEIALVRSIFELHRGPTKVALTHSEVIRFFEQERDSLALVAAQTKHRIANAAMTTAPTNAALWRAYHHMEFDDFNRIMHIMYSSEQVQQHRVGDASIRLLRDYVLAGTDRPEGRTRGWRYRGKVLEPRRLRYAKTERALRAFIEGRDLTKMYAGDATEIFPVDAVPEFLEGVKKS